MNTEKTSYQEAITTLGITQDRFRYLLKTFGERIKSVSQGKERFILSPGLELLMEAVAIINTGISPRDAVTQVAAKHQPAAVSPLVPQEDEKKDPRFEGMEKALLMMAEEVKASRQEMLSLRSEVAFLRNQLAPPLKILPAITWNPAPKPDPLVGAGYFKRFWVKLFHPEQMRRWEE